MLTGFVGQMVAVYPTTWSVAVTFSAAVTFSSTVQIANLGIGTAASTPRLLMLSQASDTIPTSFTADDAVIGRATLLGAGSGAVFARYDSTNDVGFVGSLSPSVAWRPLGVGTSYVKFQNASGVAKGLAPGNSIDKYILINGAQYAWTDSSAADGNVSLGLAHAIVTISSANITGTSSGQLGHAQGVAIVAAPGAGFALEFVSGVVILDFATAAYTGGGNISFTYDTGGATLSATASYANSVGGSADKIAIVAPTVPTNNQLVANKGINLVCAAAPTQPGTAAGVLRVKVVYRVHTTGL